MTVDLFIENKQLDLFEDESLVMISLMKDARSIDKIFTSFSRSFKLPGSDNNNKIFQHYYNANLISIDYRLKKRARIENSTVPFMDGFLKLNSMELHDNKIESYDVTFFGDTVNLPDLFGEDLISDLDWIDLNHEVGSLAYVQAGLSAAPPDLFDNKLIYPLMTDNEVEWTDILLSHGIESKQFSPAVQIIEIYKRIALKYGFTFNMPFDSETWWQKLYMWLPVNLKDEDIDPLTNYKGSIFDLNVVATPEDYPATRNPVPLEQDFIRSAFLTTSLPYPDSFRFEITLTPIAADVGKEYTVRTYISDPVSIWFYLHDPVQNFTGTGIQTFSFISDGSNNGKLFRWYAATTLEGDHIEYSAVIKCYTTINGIETLRYTTGVNNGTIYDVSSDLSMFFPRLKVIDFIAAFNKLYNFVIEPISNTEFNILPYNDWIKQGKVIDITYNVVDIDKSQVIVVDLPSEISFNYEEPTAAANVHFNELNRRAYGDLETKTVGENEPYQIKIDGFENIIWDRLDQTEEYYVGKAVDINLKAAISNIYLMFWSRDATADIKLENPDAHPPHHFDIDVYKMCDSFYPTVNPEHSLNFGSEINAYTYAVSDKSLYVDNYEEYITNIISDRVRFYKFNIVLSATMASEIKLNDTIKIHDNYYHINKIEVNLTTSEGTIELFNIVGKEVDISAPIDTESPTIGVLSCVPNIDTEDPIIGTLTGTEIHGLYTLTWTAATDNVGIDHYTIYRNGNPYTQVSGTTLIYIPHDALPGDTFHIVAYDASSNNSNDSNTVTV